MQIDNVDESSFYELESKTNNLSLKELKRQFDSALYHEKEGRHGSPVDQGW
jgi:predicted nuclease of restriction endonuclease-like (RecB) superfamily